MRRLLPPVVLFTSFCLLSSCGMIQKGDPYFTREVANISDVDHHPSKIAGSWMGFGFRKNLGGSINEEDKYYWLFRADGSGLRVQFTEFPSVNAFIEIEADIRWSYLGRNRWQVTIPGSEQYRVTASRGTTMGYKAAATEQIRYHEGRLFLLGSGSVLVPQSESAAKPHIDRLRNLRDSRLPTLRQ